MSRLKKALCSKAFWAGLGATGVLLALWAHTATITPILATDKVGDSRTVINTNFTNLDAAGDLNTTHRGSNGSDHGFIDQDVTSGAAPVLDATNFTNLAGGGTVQGTDATYDIQATNDGATDGNARGENSLDLQTERSAATMVVTSTHSVLCGGGDNTVGGGFGNSTIGGWGNNISGGNYNVLAGGFGNVVSEDHAFLGAGSSNVASGAKAVLVGGQSNVASGAHSVVVGGANTTATNTHSFVGGGSGGDATGAGSVCVGGYNGTASGTTSFVGAGEDNTASGTQRSVVVGGWNNTANQNYGTIVGGWTQLVSATHGFIGAGNQNTVSGDSACVVAGGSNTASGVTAFIGAGGSNTASTDYSVVCGGQTNEAKTNTHATVVGGLSNDATGQYSFVGGGDTCTSSGTHSAVPGGDNNTASGAYSYAHGQEAVANLHGQTAHAAGSFSAAGDAQSFKFEMRNQTTDATVTSLFLDGSAARATIASGTTWRIEMTVTARQTGGVAGTVGDSWSYKILCLIENTGGTTVVKLNNQTVEYETDDAAFDAVVDATSSATNDALDIDVTGAASKNVNWVAVIQGTQVQ